MVKSKKGHLHLHLRQRRRKRNKKWRKRNKQRMKRSNKRTRRSKKRVKRNKKRKKRNKQRRKRKKRNPNEKDHSHLVVLKLVVVKWPGWSMQQLGNWRKKDHHQKSPKWRNRNPNLNLKWNLKGRHLNHQLEVKGKRSQKWKQANYRQLKRKNRIKKCQVELRKELLNLVGGNLWN